MKPPFPYYGAKGRLAPWIAGLMPEHLALAETLHTCTATVLLSGYPSPLYDDLYADWWRAEMTVQRPASNRRGHTGPDGVEVVWSNQPLAAVRQGDLFEAVST